jgi:hypothetical protein
MLGLKWAMLVPKNQLPPILLQKHKDFLPSLRWISRRLTSWMGKPPHKWWGSAENEKFYYRYDTDKVLMRTVEWRVDSLMYEHPKPIPNEGWWIGWPLYFAWRINEHWYFRIGLRWDDWDGYYALSLTLKRYK